MHVLNYPDPSNRPIDSKLLLELSFVCLVAESANEDRLVWVTLYLLVLFRLVSLNLLLLLDKVLYHSFLLDSGFPGSFSLELRLVVLIFLLKSFNDVSVIVNQWLIALDPVVLRDQAI